eukprot:scaffold273145_cov27-Tisochrysis_lutea.AAC.3
MLIVASLCGAVLGLTASYSFSDFANMTLGDTEWNAIVFVATGLLFMGLLVRPSSSVAPRHAPLSQELWVPLSSHPSHPPRRVDPLYRADQADTT